MLKPGDKVIYVGDHRKYAGRGGVIVRVFACGIAKVRMDDGTLIFAPVGYLVERLGE